MWSLLQGAYIQVGLGKWWSRVCSAALHAVGRNTEELKGAKLKNRIWLQREKHVCSYNNRVFFLIPEGLMTLLSASAKKHSAKFYTSKGKNWLWTYVAWVHFLWIRLKLSHVEREGGRTAGLGQLEKWSPCGSVMKCVCACVCVCVHVQ